MRSAWASIPPQDGDGFQDMVECVNRHFKVGYNVHSAYVTVRVVVGNGPIALTCGAGKVYFPEG